MNIRKQELINILLVVYAVFSVMPIVSAFLPGIVRFCIMFFLIICFGLAIIISGEKKACLIGTVLTIIIFVLMYWNGKYQYIYSSKNSFVAAQFFFWMPLVLAEIIFSCEIRISRRIIDFISSIWGITIISTILGNFRYREVSRALAGAATEQEALFFAKQNIGGYGLVFGSVFLVPFWLCRFYEQKEKNHRFFYGGLVVLVVAEMFATQYTIAFLILFLELLVVFICNSRIRSLWFFVFLFGAGIVFVCPNIVGNILKNIALVLADKGRNQMADRIQALYNILMKEKVTGSTLSRSILYRRSWNSFCQSPIWGSLFSKHDLGGHSEMLDVLASTGIIGMMVYMRIIINYYKLSLLNVKRKKQVYVTLLLLAFGGFSFVDTVFMSKEIGFSVFMSPALFILGTKDDIKE